MSDKGMIMYDAVTEIRDDIIEQAADYKFRKSPMWLIKPLGIAASICLVGGAAVFAVSTLSGTGGIPVANSVTEAAGNATITAAPEITAGYVTTAAEETVYPTGTLASIVTFGTTIPEGVETLPPGSEHDAAYTGETTSEAVIATYDPDGYPSPADVPAYGVQTADTTQSTQESSADENVVVVPDDGGDDVNPGQVIIDNGDDDANPSGGGGFLMMRGYNPPVMPLTAEGDTSGITAERNITFDLTDTKIYADLNDAWKMGEYGRMSTVDEVGIIEVNDSYTLTNTTDGDKTVTLMYPSESGLDFLEGDPFMSEDYIGSRIPTVTIDGKAAKPGLIAGDFSGYFSSAAYPAGDDKSNLNEFYSYENFIDLLADGSYLKEALEAPKTIGEKVVVYRIHDYGTTIERGKLRDTLTIAVSYNLGTSADIVTYGFNGMEQNDNGMRRDTFDVPVEGWDGEHGYFGDRYIIVRGGDIEDVTFQGYLSAPLDMLNIAGEKTSDIYGEIERIEMTFGEMLPKIFITRIGLSSNLRGAYASYKDGILTEGTIYDAVMKYMCKYGQYSEKPIERYSRVVRMENQIDDAVLCERIMYATFDVTVPAGGSVTVNAKHRRYADMNELDEDGHADYGIYMFTTLGSTLDITSQTVDVIGLPDVDITEGNIGTDVKNGKLHSDIDSKETIYYLRFVPKK